MSAAIVLHAPLPAEPRSLRWESSLLQSLPYARRLQLEGRSAPQRLASLAGIALVLLGAERIVGQPVAPRNFSFPLNRKPSLAHGPEFSLSHSTQLIASCVALGEPCGIDVEDAPLEANGADIDRLRHWTATEAVLKAAGRGVRHMREVRLHSALASGVIGEDSFCLQPLAGLPGAIGHVASRAPLVLSLLAVDLDGDELSAALERSCSLAAQVD